MQAHGQRHLGQRRPQRIPPGMRVARAVRRVLRQEHADHPAVLRAPRFRDGLVDVEGGNYRDPQQLGGMRAAEIGQPVVVGHAGVPLEGGIGDGEEAHRVVRIQHLGVHAVAPHVLHAPVGIPGAGIGVVARAALRGGGAGPGLVARHRAHGAPGRPGREAVADPLIDGRLRRPREGHDWRRERADTSATGPGARWRASRRR